MPEVARLGGDFSVNSPENRSICPTSEFIQGIPGVGEAGSMPVMVPGTPTGRNRLRVWTEV